MRVKRLEAILRGRWQVEATVREAHGDHEVEGLGEAEFSLPLTERCGCRC